MIILNIFAAFIVITCTHESSNNNIFSIDTKTTDSNETLIIKESITNHVEILVKDFFELSKEINSYFYVQQIESLVNILHVLLRRLIKFDHTYNKLNLATKISTIQLFKDTITTLEYKIKYLKNKEAYVNEELNRVQTVFQRILIFLNIKRDNFYLEDLIITNLYLSISRINDLQESEYFSVVSLLNHITYNSAIVKEITTIQNQNLINIMNFNLNNVDVKTLKNINFFYFQSSWTGNKSKNIINILNESVKILDHLVFNNILESSINPSRNYVSKLNLYSYSNIYNYSIIFEKYLSNENFLFNFCISEYRGIDVIRDYLNSVVIDELTVIFAHIFNKCFVNRRFIDILKELSNYFSDIIYQLSHSDTSRFNFNTEDQNMEKNKEENFEASAEEENQDSFKINKSLTGSIELLNNKIKNVRKIKIINKNIKKSTTIMFRSTIFILSIMFNLNKNNNFEEVFGNTEYQKEDYMKSLNNGKTLLSRRRRN